MAEIGKPHREHAALALRPGDGVVDLVRDQGRAQRDIARGQPLGADQDIRRVAIKRFRREPFAQTAKTGNHLIGDIEHAVGLADLIHALVIAFGRDQHTAGAHDRLGDEGGDVIGAKLLNARLEFAHQIVAVVGVAPAFGLGIEIGLGDMADERLADPVEAEFGAVDAGERSRHIGGAVVAILPRDDLLLPVLALHVEVIADQPDSGVIGGGAAASIIDVVQIPRCQFRQFGTQLGGGDIGAVAEGVVILHVHHLFGDGFGHLLTAMANVHAPQPGNAIQQLFALRVDDMHALCALDHMAALFCKCGEIRVGVQKVGAVLCPCCLRAGGGHRGSPENGGVPLVGPSFSQAAVRAQSPAGGIGQPASFQGTRTSPRSCQSAMPLSGNLCRAVFLE